MRNPQASKRGSRGAQARLADQKSSYRSDANEARREPFSGKTAGAGSIIVAELPGHHQFALATQSDVVREGRARRIGQTADRSGVVCARGQLEPRMELAGVRAIAGIPE